MRGSVRDALFGYLTVRVVGDGRRRVLTDLAQSGVRIWDVASGSTLDHATQDYTMNVAVRDVGAVIRCARGQRTKLRFVRKAGGPFWLMRARRRKAFVAGAVFFVAALSALSSFVWHVRITGTDQPEAILAALERQNIRPGSLLYRMVNQDAVQLALLDQLPEISWVGVRVRGTAVYVHVIPRIPPARRVLLPPQNLVASVPGIVATVLADSGRPVVKPGEYVTPGTRLVSGELEDGRRVGATGVVDAVVWYRSAVALPLTTSVEMATGASTMRYFLVAGGVALPVWGFARAPYAHTVVQDVQTPIRLGDIALPLSWRAEKVMEARAVPRTLSESAALRSGLALVSHDVLERAAERARVLRQSILQKKVEHGKLYMTVWTEVLENIAKPQPIGRSGAAGVQ